MPRDSFADYSLTPLFFVVWCCERTAHRLLPRLDFRLQALDVALKPLDGGLKCLSFACKPLYSTK
jgi:hypothetical protein